MHHSSPPSHQPTAVGAAICGQRLPRSGVVALADAARSHPLPSPMDHSRAETAELTELLYAPKLDCRRLGSLVESLHGAVEAGPLEVMDLAYRSADPREYLADHSRNVAKLSMYLAQSHGYTAPTVRVVGLAGLLHDVGMRALPRQVFASPDPPEPDAAQGLWDHPQRGASIVESTQHIGSLLKRVVAPVVRQHHERSNGSGYPTGLRTRQINQFASMVSIADSFEAMVSPRSYRKPWHASRAMGQLLLDTFDADRGGLYDRELVKTFLQALSLYPVGCLVKLSSGEVARVVHSHPNHPKRPVVRPILDDAGRILEPRLIDLARQRHICIDGAWAGSLDEAQR